VVQCVAVCCSVLQCVAVCCSVLQCFAVCRSVLQCVAVCCNVLQCAAVCWTHRESECAGVHKKEIGKETYTREERHQKATYKEELYSGKETLKGGCTGVHTAKRP